jgi:hypothetical protein
MAVPYDMFTAIFLRKIAEYEFVNMSSVERTSIVDGYMKSALSDSTFKKVIDYDFAGTADDVNRTFDLDIDDDIVYDIVDIASEGMIVQWLKPFVYNQDNLMNSLSTRDYSIYSPAELIYRIGNAYQIAQKNYTQMLREYSYNHGDLTELHL